VDFGTLYFEMTPNFSPPLNPGDIKRTIGEIKGTDSGRQIVFLSGIHGNEPGGVLALQQVIRRIQLDEIKIQGKLWALQGNLAALKVNKRYVDLDLNRMWLTRYNDGQRLPTDAIEFEERRSLKMKLEDIINDAVEEVIFFDLHTTSSQSIPFVAISDTLRNRRIMKGIPVHVVLGLEEKMEGTLFSFFGEIGISMILFESGQHNLESSIHSHEAFIWLMLSKLGFLQSPGRHGFEHLKLMPLQEKPFRPQTFEIRYRHAVNGKEGFRMKPGFVNFQRVNKHQVLATDLTGNVRSPAEGRIFLPLYQEQGGDGFFIIREVKLFWIRLSGFVRRLRLDAMLSIFPGIRKHRDIPNGFLISRKLTLQPVLDAFHLLGYRKVIRHDDFFVVIRRPYDWERPPLDVVRRRFREFTQEY